MEPVTVATDFPFSIVLPLERLVFPSSSREPGKFRVIGEFDLMASIRALETEAKLNLGPFRPRSRCSLALRKESARDTAGDRVDVLGLGSPSERFSMLGRRDSDKECSGLERILGAAEPVIGGEKLPAIV